MLFRTILLCCVLALCDSASEGDSCTTKDGVSGTCTFLTKCTSGREDIKKNKRPEICDFDQAVPIVCCTDSIISNSNVATTMKIPTVSSTAASGPVYEYYDDIDRTGGCQAIPANETAAKTGQKAFDKCIDYQHEYVFPCVKTVALTGDPSRGNDCHHNADELIIGGNDTLKHEFPHMAMLGYGDTEETMSWQCGGTVISDQFVLTAGHCISNKYRLPVSQVKLGAHTRSEANNSANRYKVIKIIQHPEYKSPSKYNDIALLQTEQKIKLSQYVVPACLHVGDTVNDERVLATGWGLTQYKNQANVMGFDAEVMQKVILNKFSTEECAAKYMEHRHMPRGFDPQTQYCYGDKKLPKDTCYGDSGGPIQIKSAKLNCMYTVIGVTSFGRKCGYPGEPGIYTRVAHYIPWIESIVWP